jgi:hypothetical protein
MPYFGSFHIFYKIGQFNISYLLTRASVLVRSILNQAIFTVYNVRTFTYTYDVLQVGLAKTLLHRYGLNFFIGESNPNRTKSTKMHYAI